jgi:hypothetical protein
MNQPTNQNPGFFQSEILPNTNPKMLNFINTPTDTNGYRQDKIPVIKGDLLSINEQLQPNSRNLAYDVLRGIQEISLFSLLFFSYQNIEEIQKLIKYNVYTHSKFVIDRQSTEEIVIIMRMIYLEFSKIPSNQQDYKYEIEKLNKMVVERSIRVILSEITQQKKYLFDITNNPYIKSYGVNDSIGNKDIRDTSSVIFSQNTNILS